jgi:hypothetical protein
MRMPDKEDRMGPDQRAMNQANKIAKRLHDKWSGATEGEWWGPRFFEEQH